MFVVPGQGAQWVGMGAQLYARLPLFALARQVAKAGSAPAAAARNVLWEGDGAVDSTEVRPAGVIRNQWRWQRCFNTGSMAGYDRTFSGIAAAHLAESVVVGDAAGLVAARGS